MIEQINDHVFRVKRTDLTHNPQEIFEQISKVVQVHHTCLISRSRDHARLNGSGKLIEDVDNDYRSHALIIVHKNRSFDVTWRRRQFEIVLDRYNTLYSIIHKNTKRELLTNRKLSPLIIKAYMKAYGTIVGKDLSVKFT